MTLSNLDAWDFSSTMVFEKVSTTAPGSGYGSLRSKTADPRAFTPVTRANRPDTPPTSRSDSPLCESERRSVAEFGLLKHDNGVGDPSRYLNIKNICFVGAGFVGGPTAALIAYHNSHVMVNVVDLSQDRIDAWNSAHLPIHEPGLTKIVRIARDGARATSIDLTGVGHVTLARRKPNLVFSTQVKESIALADIIFICVNTPTKLYGLGAGAIADLSILENATGIIAKSAKDGAIIVEKSTVPCGTANMIKDILEFYRPNTHFEVLNNPEFLAEGCAVENLMFPDRILIGSATTSGGTKAAEILKKLYAAWVPEHRILTINTWSSELTKLVANAMLAQRISSINAVSVLCEELGADVQELSRGLGSDSRLGTRFLHAGVGFGGSCFEKDILNLSYMARTLYLDEVADYWMSVLDINRYQRQRFARQVVRTLNGSLQGKKIAILGFAFKENTNDTRNSVAVRLIAELATEMPAEISIFDPGCTVDGVEEEIQRCGMSDGQLQRVQVREHWKEAVEGANAVCVITPWDHFCYPPMATTTTKSWSKKHKMASLKYRGLSSVGPWFLKSSYSEAEILELEHHVTNQRGDEDSEDPLKRFVSQVECKADCAKCPKNVRAQRTSTVDWHKVAKLMREPKWVFDGRNIVDGPKLAKLGFRVKGIGKGHAWV